MENCVIQAIVSMGEKGLGGGTEFQTQFLSSMGFSKIKIFIITISIILLFQSEIVGNTLLVNKVSLHKCQ